MPKENSFMRVHSGQYQFRVPFIIYADFEAILQSSEDETELDPETSYMREINCHVPSGFCTYATFAYGEVEDPLRLYRGKDYMEVFCNHIKEEAKRLYHMFPQKLMEPLTLEQQGELIRVSECHTCLECFKPWDEKVRYHCYYTRKYRSVAHQKCNLWYGIPHYIPTSTTT